MSGYVVVFEGDAFGNSGPLGPRRQSGDQRDSYPEMPADRVMVPRRAGVCRSAGWWRGWLVGWSGGGRGGGALGSAWPVGSGRRSYLRHANDPASL